MSDTDNPKRRAGKPLERPTLTLPSRQAPPASRPALPVPAAPKEKEEAPSPGGGLARLLEAIGRLLTPKPPPPGKDRSSAPPPPAEPPVFTVAVASLANDSDGQGLAHLLRTLDGRAALALKVLPRVFTLGTLEDPAAVTATTNALRHATAGESASVLVWGEMDKDGYRIRLATATAPDDDRPGAFGPTTRFELPLEFDEPPAALLYAAVLAAAEAETEAQKGAVRRLLPTAAAKAEPVAAKPPLHMSMPQQCSMQLVFGHVAAATALAVPPSQAGPWFEKAVESYHAAQKRLARTAPPWETGLLHRYAAAAAMARAERAKEPAPFLDAAVREWRSAAENLSRDVMPQEWAMVQTRLGKALYRLDLITGDTDLLREALQVLQTALQVYSRTETPLKWADVMHDIAQVLEVYGDQLRSPEVLRRSIETCESVLQVLNQDRTPLSWATARNTLGSTLFLLDKHTDGIGNLADAEAILANALDVFVASGAKKQAQVAARNLGHVRKLAEERRGRQIIDPDWADGRPPRRRR
ncbi:MAG: hypothetical protein M0006_05240 [Magnetospirillum sp.]|nr:hypothetical protein [Magnetospirillum sp.]